MNNIKVTFDGKEYFAIQGISASHTISRNIALKEVSISAASMQVTFKDFLIALNKKGVMLASVFVNNKLYIQNYVTHSSFGYKDTPSGGTEIKISISDRFVALIESDIFETQVNEKSDFQSFLGNILSELKFDDPRYINNYKNKIKKAKDLIVNGQSIEYNLKIKSIKNRKDLLGQSVMKVISESLMLSKVFLISNGFDRLTLEKPSSDKIPVFNIVRKNNQSNIEYSQKTDVSQGRPTPFRNIILNSNSKASKSDNNQAVVINNSGGLPHIQKIKTLSTELSYREIVDSIDQEFAGMKARDNSYLYKIPHNIFDLNGNFIRPNQSIRVLDDKYGIDAIMSVLQVRFSFDPTNGSELILNLTPKRTFIENKNIKQQKNKMTQ